MVNFTVEGKYTCGQDTFLFFSFLPTLLLFSDNVYCIDILKAQKRKQWW